MRSKISFVGFLCLALAAGSASSIERAVVWNNEGQSPPTTIDYDHGRIFDYPPADPAPNRTATAFC